MREMTTPLPSPRAMTTISISLARKADFARARTSQGSADSPTIPMHTTNPVPNPSPPRKFQNFIPRQRRRSEAKETGPHQHLLRANHQTETRSRQVLFTSPDNHNKYVMRVGYMLAKKRYAHADVLKWALQKFPEYNDVEQVIKSCYDNTPGASRKASGGGGGGGGNGGSDNRFASVEEIRIFLDGHIRLRYNLITQRYEFLEIPEGASPSARFRQTAKMADTPRPTRQLALDQDVAHGESKQVGYAQYHRERLYARIQSLRGLLRPSPALEGGRQGLHRRTRCHREGEGYRQLRAELRGMPEKVARGNDCQVGWTKRRSTMSSWSLSEDRVPTRPPGSIISFRRS